MTRLSSTRTARPEPTSLAEMHARKCEADLRQAAAARALAETGKPQRAVAPPPPPKPAAAPPRAPQPAPAAPSPAPEPSAPKDWTADPEIEAKIRAMLGGTFDRNPRRIITQVAEAHGLLAADILGDSRQAAIHAARREAMGAVRLALPKASLPWIARQFGRDHTTVLHNLRELGLVPPAAEITALAVNAPDDHGLRRVQSLVLADLNPAPLPEALPEFRQVDPTTLLIDPAYQRNLSEQSLGLIRRVVDGWSWAAFKTPIVVQRGTDLHVIDGQHTAMAAATHGGIPRIPVMVVQAETQRDRARAFVQHNRDRVAMSAPQIHYGLVAAGDETALIIDAVCRETGARILRSKPHAFKVGETLAIVAIRNLVIRRGHEGAARVMRACVEAELAPVAADAIRAIEALLFDPLHVDQFDETVLAEKLRSLGAKADREASVFAAQHRVPIWRGLAVILARAAGKSSRKARGAA